MRITSENTAIRILAYLGQLVMLNFLLFLFSIPIITAGAALTAGYACIMDRDEPGTRVITTDFFRAFVKNFRQATQVWLSILIGLAVAFGDIFYALGSTEINAFFAVFGILLVFVIISCSFWVFPIIAFYNNNCSGHIRSGLLMAFGHLPHTLYIWLIWILPILVTIFNDEALKYFGWLWLMCGISGLMAAACRAIKKIVLGQN